MFDRFFYDLLVHEDLMIKHTILLVITLFLLHTSLCKAQKVKIKEVNVGYAIYKSSLYWSISGGEKFENQNIMSELKWDNIVMMLPVGTSITYNNWEATIDVSIGKFIAGNVYDTDYYSSDRTDMSYNQSFGSSGGAIAKYSFLIEYSEFPKLKIGYIKRKQNYIIQHGDGFESTYNVNFNGVAVTYGYDWSFRNRFVLYCNSLLYGAFYRAQADWVKRTELQHPVSFTHDTFAFGLESSAGITCNYARISFAIKVMLDTGSSLKGNDMLYKQDGGKALTNLNPIKILEKGFVIQSIIKL